MVVSWKFVRYSEDVIVLVTAVSVCGVLSVMLTG
jgi:hypothetical protein